MPSAYNIFGKDIRPKLTEDNPEKKPKDIMKMIADQWKSMSLEDKQKYKDEAAALKPAPAPKIKKPICAYIFYSKDVFKTTKGKFAERTAEVAAKWKALTQEEKEPYMEMAVQDAERYKTAIGKNI